MEKKQSSIELLIEQLLSQHGIDITRLAVTDKAKAMHKEEIEKAYGHGQNNGYMCANQRAIMVSKENYFNQTFKGDK